MGSPLPDAVQKNRFLEGARKLGFEDHDFTFGMASRAPGDPAQSRRITHHVWISRGGRRNEYEQAGNATWADAALKDLADGAFGAKDEIDDAVLHRIRFQAVGFQIPVNELAFRREWMPAGKAKRAAVRIDRGSKSVVIIEDDLVEDCRRELPKLR